MGMMRGKYKILNGERMGRKGRRVESDDDVVDKRPRDTSVNNIISLIQPKSPRVCYATHPGLDAPHQQLYR